MICQPNIRSFNTVSMLRLALPDFYLYMLVGLGNRILFMVLYGVMVFNYFGPNLFPTLLLICSPLLTSQKFMLRYRS